MKWLTVFVSFLFLHSAYANNITAVDDAGRRVTLSAPAQRIISLAPDVTETLFAIGAGQQLVGVMQGSDYPAQALRLPIVGSYSGLDLERIMMLHPDLVIVWGDGFAAQLSILKKLHIPVYVSQPSELQAVANTMRQLGVLTGHAAEASRQASLFDQRIEHLREQYQHQTSVAVFYQLGSTSLMTINRHSWINQVISLCGGRNVFANALTAAPEVSWESIIQANPAVVLNDGGGPDWQVRWQHWQSIAAVQHHRLYQMHSDWIDRAGPRLLLGAAEMCRHLHEG